APDARRLFPNDMDRQHIKLMDTIAAIVGALDQRALFQSIITHTGRKHARFGVSQSHFVAFGDAMVWCLEQQFGSAFTPELRAAWIALYDAVQSEMMRAGKEAGRSAVSEREMNEGSKNPGIRAGPCGISRCLFQGFG